MDDVRFFFFWNCCGECVIFNVNNVGKMFIKCYVISGVVCIIVLWVDYFYLYFFFFIICCCYCFVFVGKVNSV